jgi:hypothetical protein
LIAAARRPYHGKDEFHLVPTIENFPQRAAIGCALMAPQERATTPLLFYSHRHFGCAAHNTDFLHLCFNTRMIRATSRSIQTLRRLELSSDKWSLACSSAPGGGSFIAK